MTDPNPSPRDSTQDSLPNPAAPAATVRPWWWRLLGMRRREGRWLRIVPTRWGWVLIVTIVGLGGMVGFAEYSMQPDFCRSCHLMEPYYQAWHQSTHKNVPCGDCHFEPGWQNTIKGKFQASSQAVKFLTGTYGSKPHAEVRDSSCLRSGCHEKRLLEGKVNWPVQSQRGHEIIIRFDHTPHLTETRRGQKLRCVSCHSQMVQGKHIVVTLDSCFLCHFKGFEHGRTDQTLGGCRSCHDAPQQEVRLASGMFKHANYIDRGVPCQDCHSDSISGDGAVPRQLCWNCHNQPDQIARFGDTTMLHETHVNKTKVECSSCHMQITHNLTAGVPAGAELLDGAGAHALAKAGSCGQCHEKLHNGVVDMYRGHGGQGVDDSPSPMFLTQVDCIACHQKALRTEGDAAFRGQDFRADQAACDACHGNEYTDRLAEWKRGLALKETEAKLALERARAALPLDAPVSIQALERRRLLDEAQHNFSFVQQSRGVHNVTYATKLLNQAIADCKAVLGEPSAPNPPPAATQP